MRILIAVLFAFLLCKAASAGESVAPLNDALYLSIPVVVDNVTVWPIYSKKPPQDVGDFITLDLAQKQSLAIIRETGAQPQNAANAAAANAPNVAQPQAEINPQGRHRR